MIDMALVYGVEALVAFASQALEAVGLSRAHEQDKWPRFWLRAICSGMIHMVWRSCPGYLASAREGEMAFDGTPDTLNERPAAALWDGRKLPGPWLITEGLQTAMEKAEYYGTFTLSIRNSHHTAGLVSYLKPVTDRGLVGLVMVSDPTEQCVAPFGGCQPVLSTNPFAIGYPSRGSAVMLDMSTAMTTNGMVKRLYNEKSQFAHEWLIDADGTPSCDPAIRFAKTPGAIMPLGGFSAGYKGTGLGMTVEALTHEPVRQWTPSQPARLAK